MVTVENTISFVLLAWGFVGLFNYIPEFYYLPHTRLHDISLRDLAPLKDYCSQDGHIACTRLMLLSRSI